MISRSFRCAFLPVILTTMTAYSQQRSYYTDARLTAARRNIEAHDWAREERNKILAEADRWLQYDETRLRTLVPPPQVPRAVVAHEAGAPVKGEELNRKGRYSWIIDFDKPWKVTSPVDGAVYPSNDFAAYLESGLQDRTLLTGPYPDDGWGCHVEGFDKPFWFVGVYTHWSVVRLLLPAIENLSKAYLLSENPRYAHACAVLLHQLAIYYPDYRYEKQSRYGTEVRSDYLGRLLYHTWESLYTCQTVPPAYDAVRPALEDDAMLLERTGMNAEDLRRFIEERLFVTMANDIMDGSGRIAGNYGMHQVALLRIAKVLSHRTEAPTRADMVEWVVGTNPNAGSYVQMGLEDAVNNLLYRDGYALENPGYNTHWSLSMGDIVSELGPDADTFIAMPRFRKLYTWPLRMAVAGKYSPAYGDGGNIWNGVIGWDKRVMVTGYRFYRDPMMAKALVTHYGDARASRELFRENIEEDMEQAAEALEAAPGTTSELLPGVGFASIQTENAGSRIGATLFYGYYWGHRHQDTLSLDLFSLHADGFGYSWLPDLGYPETAGAWDPRRYGFISHTVCHNTVMVNASAQEIRRGRLHLYDRGPFVKIIEASAEDCYPGTTSRYRRTLIMVDVAPDNAYLVDIFRVRGGSQHDWIIHGTDAEFSSDLDLPPPREQGTLAGPDVPYGMFYDDERYANNNEAHVPYTRYRGSAFQWLFDVQETALDGVRHVQWKRGKAFMRAHFVPSRSGRQETVFACKGRPQRRKPFPETIMFVFRRRTGGDDLESVYVTVFEPFHTAPFIQSVRPLPPAQGADAPVALELQVGHERHVVCHRLEVSQGKPRTVFNVPGVEPVDARAAVLAWSGDRLTRQYVLDGETGGAGVGHADGVKPLTELTAQVVAVDYAKGRVTTDKPLPNPDTVAGGVAVVESGSHANALEVAGIVDNTVFDVGDDDLYAARIHVQAIERNELRYLPMHTWFIEPGMTVVDETGTPVARVQKAPQAEGRVLLNRYDLTLENFPDADGDGRRSCTVMIIGPGDTLRFHRASRSPAP